jgi:hypothetical protein
MWHGGGIGSGVWASTCQDLATQRDKRLRPLAQPGPESGIPTKDGWAWFRTRWGVLAPQRGWLYGGRIDKRGEMSKFSDILVHKVAHEG